MSDKKNFADIQRLNSAVMAKSAWASSLIGMRKTGEEVHHRRTNTHRQANEFLQGLLNRRSDGSSVDDNGVTDRYHRFLRNKSDLNDDGHIRGEFDQRLRALNANRVSKRREPTDEGSSGVRWSPAKSAREESFPSAEEFQPGSSSKSTLNSNGLSHFFSSTSQGNMSYHGDEHPLSSSEESLTSSVSQSIAKISPKSTTGRADGRKQMPESATQPPTRHINQQETEQLSTSSSNQATIASRSKTNDETILTRTALESFVQHAGSTDRAKRTSTSSSERSATEFSQQSHRRKLAIDEDPEESIRLTSRAHAQQSSYDPQSNRHPTRTALDDVSKSKVPVLESSDSADESSVLSSQQSVVDHSQQSTSRQTITEDRSEKTPAAAFKPASTKVLPNPRASQSHEAQSDRPSQIPTAKRSIQKPSAKLNARPSDDRESTTKTLPEQKSETVDESTPSSSTLLDANTLYRPVARHPDGRELSSSARKSPTQHASTEDSFFEQRFFPRSLLAREPVSVEKVAEAPTSSLPTKQYDKTQLLYLLDSIETECSPVDFTLMLDQLNPALLRTSDNDLIVSFHDDSTQSDEENEESIPFISHLFDPSPSSDDYYSTFTANIVDPKKISLYRMTIGIVQLAPSRLVPYSILVGHRPVLQQSQKTNFRRIRSRRHKHTYQITAIESVMNTEQIQKNDIIVKINDQLVWHSPLDVVRNVLNESYQRSGVCSLTIARLRQPLI